MSRPARTALLAAGTLASLLAIGTLAGAGPRDWGRDRDDRHERDHDRGRGGISIGVHIGTPRIEVRTPVVVRPAPHVHVRHDVAPRALQIEAFQSGDQVIVIAKGENATGGYLTRLERCDPRDRTELVLRNLAPDACDVVTQACAPFAVSGGIDVRGRVREITVRVGGREQCVPVTQVDEIGYASR